jgi:hypothetical protein
MLAKSLTRFRQSPIVHARAFGVYEKTFMADDLQFRERAVLKDKPSADHVYTFGGITTDYMLEIDYDRENGGW